MEKSVAVAVYLVGVYKRVEDTGGEQKHMKLNGALLVISNISFRIAV